MSDATQVWSAERIGELLAPPPGRTVNRFRDGGGWTVRMHDDVFEDLSGEMDEARRKRVQSCFRELLAQGICNRRKVVKGINRGWMRTQLGGTGGSQYYLWWAKKGYPPVKHLDLDDGEVLVRAIRHHDDTGILLDPGSLDDFHLVTPADAFDESGGELTAEQLKVVDLHGPPIRIVKGYPGSGKTTALMEAASREWGDQVLYLTFSGRLQSEAEQLLRTFTPADVTAESMTFGQLIALFGAGGPGVEQPIVIPKLIERFERHLRNYRGRLGKWERRIPELYAQLHAHAFGAALPIAFDGAPASDGPVLNEAAFVDLHKEALGSGTAKKAAEVARFLVKEDLVAECFPGVHAAHRLVGESSADLPTPIAGTSVVMIDEVQDLTKVEAMFVLSVVGRLAQGLGHVPHVFVAGDESQTVRPTSFSWAWFTNLMTVMLGPAASQRTEVNLRSNLRSPRVVASLIEATRKHYQVLDRVNRPGGMVYERPEIDRDGRLFYCHAPGDEWLGLVELFREQTSSQLVYPGAVPPEDLGDDVDVATADQVKGLGFELVGVVDAGRRHEELMDLADEVDRSGGERLAGTLGRNLADQFRVAVSRAQEHLVLVDRDDDRSQLIQDLLDEVNAPPIERVDAVTLAGHVVGDVDTLEWFERRLVDVQSILTDNPESALAKVRSAVDRLGTPGVREQLPDPLVREVFRSAGIAAYLTAVEERNLSHGDQADEWEQESKRYMEEAGLGEPMDALLALRRAGGRPSPQVVAAAAGVHFQIAKELAELESQVSGPLADWFEQVGASGLDEEADVDASIVALDAVVGALDGRVPDLEARQRSVLIASAERARLAQDFDRALRLLDEVDNADLDLIAECLRGAGRIDDAIARYEEEGRLADALAFARETGDLERAVRLADQHAPDVAGRLRWAQSVLDLVRPELTDRGEPLTEAELEALQVQVTLALRRTVASGPSDDALVNRWRIDDPLTEATGWSDVDAPPAFAEVVLLDDEVVLLDDQEESPETWTEVPTPPPYPPADEPIDLPSDRSVPSPTQRNVSELTPLVQLAGELGVSLEELRQASQKLGVAPTGADEVVSVVQAERLRRRVAR